MVDSFSERTSLEAGPGQICSEDHIALIYETSEERLAAITPLIKVGLEKGELCLYISNDENDQCIVEALRAEHIDVEKAVSTGGLILTHKNEIYFKMGRFDPEWTLRVIKNIAELAQSYGFTAMRIMTEMAWTLEKVPGVERWAEYEAKMNALDPGICVRIICQYDRTAFSPEALLLALRAHPKVVSQGAVYTNTYFVPTDQLLAGEQASVELDRVMGSIRASSSADAELQARDLELEQLREQMDKEALSRRSAELSLEESRKRFNDLAERTSDWAWELGGDGTYTYASPRVRDLLGLQIEEVLGRTPQELVAPDDAERVHAILEPTMSQHSPITALEKKVRHRDGRAVYLEMSGAPLFDGDGGFLGYRGIDRDITGRKASKKAIDEGRQKVEGTIAEIMVRDGRIKALEEEIGQLRGSLGEHDAALDIIKRALGQKEKELDGAVRELEQLRSALSSRDGEALQARASLEEKEAELNKLREEVGTVRSAAAQSEEALAQSKAALEVKEAELAVATAALSVKEAEAMEMRSGLDGLTAEAAAARKDSEDLRAAAGEGEKELGQLREEIERARAQAQQMNDETERLRELLRTKEAELAEAVAFSEKSKAELSEGHERSEGLESAKRLLEEENARLITLLQEKNAEIGRMEKEAEVLHAEEGERTAALTSRDIELGMAKQRLGAAEGEIARLTEALRSSGRELANIRAQGADGSAVFPAREARIAELETTLVLREEALNESNQRTRALYEQAAIGIARIDLEGNLLAANTAFYQMIGRGPDELVGRSYRECTHRDDLVISAELYRRLLSGELNMASVLKRYVRKYGDIVWVNLSVSAVRDAQGKPRYFMAVVSDRTDQMFAETALREKEREGEATEARPVAGPSAETPVLSDPSALSARSEAIAHRLNNALTVIMGGVSLAKEYVIPEGRMFGQLGQIERASAEVRELAAQLHEVSQGRAPEISDRDGPVPYRPAELVMGQGRVLLVDGDESVLETTGDMLRHLGYTVEVARDGEEAASIGREAREGQQPFRLTILDLGAPGSAEGRATAARLAQENPGLRLVASTGHIADPVLTDPTAHGFSAALPRPYTAEELSKAVSEALSRPL